MTNSNALKPRSPIYLWLYGGATLCFMVAGFLAEGLTRWLYFGAAGLFFASTIITVLAIRRGRGPQR